MVSPILAVIVRQCSIDGIPNAARSAQGKYFGPSLDKRVTKVDCRLSAIGKRLIRGAGALPVVL